MIAARLSEKQQAESTASAPSSEPKYYHPLAEEALGSQPQLEDDAVPSESAELIAAKKALAENRPIKGKEKIGTCNICLEDIEARRDAKVLPCGHVFHFACIDGYHRKQLHEEKNADLKCQKCGEPVRKSIQTLADERKKQREAQKAEEAAKKAAEEARAQDEPPEAGRTGGFRAPVRKKGALSQMARANSKDKSDKPADS
eukprot:gnl/MRDRNA2_/MRDRNA2_100821_c0_seq1.p1 gnl/MRDRNA2_/MRDRNA2_100821_c0~~gnl/MRDRNA2_/MRDRNA2_100821_c0_seq1.p1  ORF type:complete len:213 (-),score=56.95 gnl/MRDRNA2_/MRDRNA2_100821_c0_seq1:22-624(-)